ncbi:MAG: hypothetical protein KGJ07_09745 [Patescibacteria group bacterium]|nr:hypothetical protein [Patescibacteria group bacterium]
MRTDKEIIKQLHTLQSVTPSDRLRQRIALVGKHLPVHTHAGYASIFPFRSAFALAVFLLWYRALGRVLSYRQTKASREAFCFR